MYLPIGDCELRSLKAAHFTLILYYAESQLILSAEGIGQKAITIMLLELISNDTNKPLYLWLIFSSYIKFG